MKELLQKLGKRVIGVLSGFDRLLFRGHLRCVITTRGLDGYLYGAKVPMTDFDQHAKAVSRQLIEESLREPRECGCEVRYLDNSRTGKQDVAKQIAHRDGIHQGRICVLKAVEPCMSFALQRDRHTKTISLVRRQRKCLHLYHYFKHPQFGLMHVRLQTWFPFTIQVCLNGREWLARQLTAAGIGYQSHENCIWRVDDMDAAQTLFDQQRCAAWPALLNGLRRLVHPAHETIFANCPPDARGYYWSTAESEWASDVLFQEPAEVLPLAERLVGQSMRVHGAGDVMRFLGRTVTSRGLPHGNFRGKIQSDVRCFEQGLRIKHRLNANSVKMYNRPSVLRFETTINNPAEFKVFRTSGADPEGPRAWRSLRKNVADLYRRAQVSQTSNNRYAAAQAAVLDDDTRLKELAQSLCSRVRQPGRAKPDGSRTRSRTHRALNPFSPQDLLLLETVSRGEFVISGMRNGDLRKVLFGADPTDAREKRRCSSAVSRKLALLRAHGILRKVSKSHRYQVTAKGRQALSALLAAANATTDELTKLAA